MNLNMAKNFRELQSKMSLERRKRNEAWVAGWKARYAGQPIEAGMANPDCRDGWAEADQAILGEWASKNKIGKLAEGFTE